MLLSAEEPSKVELCQPEGSGSDVDPSEDEGPDDTQDIRMGPPPRVINKTSIIDWLTPIFSKPKPFEWTATPNLTNSVSQAHSAKRSAVHMEGGSQQPPSVRRSPVNAAPPGEAERAHRDASIRDHAGYPPRLVPRTYCRL